MPTVLEFGPVTALLVISVILALIISNISRVMGPQPADLSQVGAL